MNHLGRAVLLALAGICAAVGFGAGDHGEDRGKSGHHVIVVAVIDGDTIRVSEPDGRDLGRVRLTRIDAPELGRDGQPDQCWAPQARTALARLTPVGATVTLHPDPAQPDRDRYGRLLRHVEHDGQDVGRELLEEGSARHSPARSHRSAEYAAAQDQARSNPSGLWGHCPT